MKDKIFSLFLTVVYFVIFLFLIDLVFRNTLSVFTDLLAVGCWIIAFIVSVILADHTVKKIENKYFSDEEEISSNGSSIVYVIKNNEVLALIGVKDIVRDNAKKTIFELKKLGKEIIMLTGDNENATRSVADILKIDNVISDVTPKDKMIVNAKFINTNTIPINIELNRVDKYTLVLLYPAIILFLIVP